MSYTLYSDSKRQMGRKAKGWEDRKTQTINQSATGEFYEIEPAMVYDIAMEDHPRIGEIGGYPMIGAVQFNKLGLFSGKLQPANTARLDQLEGVKNLPK